MMNPKRSVAAILVAYHPDSDPGPAIEAVLALVAQVVLVDNSQGGHPAARVWRHDPRVRVLHHRNEGGLAGAYNAALRFLADERAEVSHIVFIDEDSEANVLGEFLGDRSVQEVLCDAATAAAAPAHRERMTGLRARHMMLSPLCFRYLPRECHGLNRVTFIINSMSVWRLDAIRRIGAFNEGLAVDHIDTEYCMRAKRLGLAVYLHGDYEFDHSIGRRRAYRFAGAQLQSGGHGPARRYMIGRNTAWLARNYVLLYPAFSALCLLRIGYECLGILIAERDKSRKLLALLIGACRGVVARLSVSPGRKLLTIL